MFIKSPKNNLILLAFSQAIFVSATILSFTFAGLIGKILAPIPEITTLPVAMTGLGTLLLTFPASILMRKIGRRNGFIIGTLCGITCGFLGFISIYLHSFVLFCIACFFMGIYQAFAQYYRFAATEIVNKSYASKAISIILVGGVLGAIMGPMLGTLFYRILPLYNYAEISLIIIAVSFIGLIINLFVNVPQQQAHLILSLQNKIWIIKYILQKDFFIAVTNACISYFIMILLMTATPLSMNHCGFNITSINFIIQWHLLGMYLPSFFTGHLIHKYGIKKIYYLGIIFFIISSFFVYYGNSFIDFIISLIAVGIGWNFIYISSSTLLVTSFNKEAKTLIQGINEVCIFSTVSIASCVAGFLVTTIGWQKISLVTIPFIIFAIITTKLYYKK